MRDLEIFSYFEEVLKSGSFRDWDRFTSGNQIPQTLTLTSPPSRELLAHWRGRKRGQDKKAFRSFVTSFKVFSFPP